MQTCQISGTEREMQHSALTLCSLPGSPLTPGACLAKHPSLVLGVVPGLESSWEPASRCQRMLRYFSAVAVLLWCPFPLHCVMKHSVVLHVNTGEIREWSISSLGAPSSRLAQTIPEECSCLSPGSFL